MSAISRVCQQSLALSLVSRSTQCVPARMKLCTRPGLGVSTTDAGIVMRIDGVIVVTIMWLLLRRGGSRACDAHTHAVIQRCCTSMEDLRAYCSCLNWQRVTMSVQKHLHQ